MWFGRSPGSLLAIASIGTYAACLFMPSFEVVTGYPDLPLGYLDLLLGALAVPLAARGEVLFSLAWLANPALVAAHVNVVLSRPVRACIFASAAVVFSASFALVADTPLQGAGARHPIALHSGYVLWVGSTVLALAAAFTAAWRSGGNNPLKHHPRLALWIALLSVGYIALGSLLPGGKLAIYRS